LTSNIAKSLIVVNQGEERAVIIKETGEIPMKNLKR